MAVERECRCPWPNSGNPLLSKVCACGARNGGSNPGLEARVTALEDVTTQQAADISTLSSMVTDQSAQITDLSGQVSTLTGEVSNLTGQVSALSGQVSTLSGEVTTLTGQVDTLSSEVTTLSSEVTTLSGDLTSLTDRVAALEAQPAPVQQEAIYVWDGSSYNVPDTPIDGVIVRHFYGPNPYDGDPWPGVLDVYEQAETVA